MSKRLHPQIGVGVSGCCPGVGQKCMMLGMGDRADEWGRGQNMVKIGGRSMQARVTVLLIAPFAFKEIKLFLVCTTAGETPEEAFPSLRFSGSCQVWASTRFWEPPE